MKPLIIDKWNIGMRQSAYDGFVEIRNIDTLSRPGVAYLNYALTRDTEPSGQGNAIGDLITKFVIGGTILYAIDNADDLYRLLSGGWSKITGYTESGTSAGLGHYKGYLIIPKSSGRVHTYRIDNGDINNNWQELGVSQDRRPTILGQDDILYIANGRYVASINEVTTFNPADSGSFTFNAQALDLPSGTIVKCFAEMGELLMIGADTPQGAVIYPWDRRSASFNLPIILNERSIEQMATHNNLVYYSAGGRGKWAVTNGLNVSQLGGLSEDILDKFITSSSTVSSSGAQFFDNRILFTVSGSLGGVDGISGVYSLDPKDSGISFEAVVSNNSTVATNLIGATIVFGGNFYVGWKSTTDAAIDKFSANIKSSGFIITPLYRVGEANNERTFSKLELILGKKLPDLTSVKIEYRKTLDDDWTEVLDEENPVAGGNSISKFTANFGVVATDLQLKITLNGAAVNTPYLREIILT